MAFKAPVPQGASYAVSYQSSNTSGGVTLLTVGWVPRNGRPVPEVEDELIAASVTKSIEGTVPSAEDARRLEIRIDLPNGTGSGILTMTINGKDHAVAQLTEDTVWTSIVV